MAAAFVVSCSSRASVEWREGVADPATGLADNTLVIYNPPRGTDWSVWFTQMNSTKPLTMLEGSNGAFERFNGSLYRAYPTEECRDSMVIHYRWGAFPRVSWTPESFWLQLADGSQTKLDVRCRLLPFDDVPRVAHNEVPVSFTDMIPRLKSVEAGEGETEVKFPVEAEIVEGHPAAWYSIVLDGAVHVQASDADGAFYAEQTLRSLVANNGSEVLPNVVIEDWPDLPHRGVMLDVARNFTGKEDVKRFIDIMAHHKMNVLHMHLVDDEGWRLEIPGLPELTSFGSVHALPVKGEDGTYRQEKGLMPTYGASADPYDFKASSSGYYTVADFQEIIRYAAERHIRVVPEFDIPGHSRAALYSMEKYYERTGDASLRLIEPEDASVYDSAQHYYDCVLNVALESTYKFVAMVMDSVMETYRGAGVPLEDIHIGGDEVPVGSWLGSPSCQALLAQLRENAPEERTDTDLLKTWFINRILDLVEERGLKMDGWQEVVLHLDEESFDRLRRSLRFVNCWSTVGANEEVPYRFANNGVPAVLSNVTHTYADLAYNYGKGERGLSWGGFIDERRSFSLLPFNIYKSTRWKDNGEMANISLAGEGREQLDCPDMLLGVQIQLWSETIRCFDDVTTYIFPKMYGAIERGWNASPSWGETTRSDSEGFLSDFDVFCSIIDNIEIPYLDSVGMAHR